MIAKPEPTRFSFVFRNETSRICVVLRCTHFLEYHVQVSYVQRGYLLFQVRQENRTARQKLRFFNAHKPTESPTFVTSSVSTVLARLHCSVKTHRPKSFFFEILEKLACLIRLINLSVKSFRSKIFRLR